MPASSNLSLTLRDVVSIPRVSLLPPKRTECHNCVIQVTERSKHASEIASKIPAYGQYDALALLSGDGLIHEVFNGFAEHDDPLKAFSIPIAPIPTGSGNGTAINLLGLEVRLFSVL